MIKALRLTILIALLAGTGFVFLSTVAVVQAQQPASAASERDRGIQLYQAGDIKGAVDALRRAVKQNANDVTAWHYLGLALEQKGDRGGAKKAHEKASQAGDALLDRALVDEPGKDIPRGLLAIRSQLIEAAESAERYLALNPKMSKSKAEEWNTRIESVRSFAELASDKDMTFYSSKEVTTKVRILRKPEPSYTDQARKHMTRGTVALRCIFGANGKVFGFHVMAGLPDGLTEMSIRAARQIKFVPATKDGRPVSMWLQIEYNFNIY